MQSKLTFFSPPRSNSYLAFRACSVSPKLHVIISYSMMKCIFSRSQGWTFQMDGLLTEIRQCNFNIEFAIIQFFCTLHLRLLTIPIMLYCIYWPLSKNEVRLVLFFSHDKRKYKFALHAKNGVEHSPHTASWQVTH